MPALALYWDADTFLGRHTPVEGCLMPALALYWDANIFLSYINGYADRLPTLDALLARADAGDAAIYTSAISQVEVAFADAEKRQRVLDPQAEQNIDRLWNDSKAIMVIEYHPVIGRGARALVRNAMTHGQRLTPLDAVHLATAQWLHQNVHSIAEFHTYDHDLNDYAPIVGFTICEPYLHLQQPGLI